jgi:hypothetical protein
MVALPDMFAGRIKPRKARAACLVTQRSVRQLISACYTILRVLAEREELFVDSRRCWLPTLDREGPIGAIADQSAAIGRTRVRKTARLDDVNRP